jgi:hypothetical protein
MKKSKVNTAQLRKQVNQEINANRIIHTPKSAMTHAEREALADGMFEEKYWHDSTDNTLRQRILLHGTKAKLNFTLV